MKITETISRECCQQKDLKPVEGTRKIGGGHYDEFKFCVHCGTYWEAHRVTDAAGGYDTEYRRCRPPWDPAVAASTVECTSCHGEGRFEDPQHGHSMRCSRCGGTGRVDV